MRISHARKHSSSDFGGGVMSVGMLTSVTLDILTRQKAPFEACIERTIA